MTPARLQSSLSVGIQQSVGHPWEFFDIVKAMPQANILPDFIVVDGS